ncbi:uncharacterized protein HD556DRAFT_1400879 [Suillus plorans]|uniref:Uncharacterized protein n=1 Tax=Suillus plorans TaxID=116603 RepID=A0A9P7AGC5_9AGAM|nr:uncharacterized protein HD556DRAFT_1400879 [Suillus plorans]KAG1788941.1 hypothetical protein HD556DRAFT_1400879 [Suillus plorans]
MTSSYMGRPCASLEWISFLFVRLSALSKPAYLLNLQEYCTPDASMKDSNMRIRTLIMTRKRYMSGNAPMKEE